MTTGDPVTGEVTGVPPTSEVTGVPPMGEVTGVPSTGEVASEVATSASAEVTSDFSTSADSDVPGDITATGGLPEVCEAVPGESACTTCVREECCDEIVACLADPDCACVEICFEASGFDIDEVAFCAFACGVNVAPPEGEALLECHQLECGGCTP